MKKKFRIAKAGQTTDGRVISLEHINQMAANYDPKKYGARINLEHIQGFFPDSVFRMYGDVIALSTETEDDETYLVAEIEPTEDLIALSKKKQKVYFSIELDPDFADTGEAYLVGLACTDNPASLGTSYMKFCQQDDNDNPLAARKANERNLISTAEFSATFEAKTPEKPTSLFKFMSNLFKTDDEKEQAQKATEMADAIGEMPENFKNIQKALLEFSKTVDDQSDVITKLNKQVDDQAKKLSDLKTLLDNTPEHQYGERPPATGGSDYIKTDC